MSTKTRGLGPSTVKRVHRPCPASRCLRSIVLLTMLACQPTFAEDLVPALKIRTEATVDPDDLCFVRGPASEGLIVESDKAAGAVFLFAHDGTQLDRLEINKPGNIDSRFGFVWRGETTPLIVVNQRAGVPQLRALTVELHGERVRLVALPGFMPTGPNYGGCLYRGDEGRTYFFSTTEGDGGSVKQFELRSEAGRMTAHLCRSWIAPICEGAVADDRFRAVYVCEERRGVRKLLAEPNETSLGRLIVKVGEFGVTGDLEGITLLMTGDKSGFLIASDQGQDCFVVLDREPPHRFVGRFSVSGARHTDGVDLSRLAFGKQFPAGLFACHSDQRDGSCVMLVPLPTVRDRLTQIW